MVDGRPRLRKPNVRGQMIEADGWVNMPLLIEYGTAQPVEAESAAPLPANRLGNSALFTINHGFKPWNTMRNSLFAHLNSDVASPHLVCDCGCGA